MRLAALRPPRLRTIDEEERSATWLELFYDLAFVAAVAVLGGRILNDPSWEGLLSYAAFFGLLWWLWSSHTFYADRFDTDDLVYRLFATAQIIAIVIVAASLTADSGSTLAFAIGYATARLILLALYARAYLHVPQARILIAGYLKGFGFAAFLWVVAIFVPEPGRFWIWGLALAVDLATPFVDRVVALAEIAIPRWQEFEAAWGRTFSAHQHWLAGETEQMRVRLSLRDMKLRVSDTTARRGRASALSSSTDPFRICCFKAGARSPSSPQSPRIGTAPSFMIFGHKELFLSVPSARMVRPPGYGSKAWLVSLVESNLG